jgi:hypothetical protein
VRPPGADADLSLSGLGAQHLDEVASKEQLVDPLLRHERFRLRPVEASALPISVIAPLAVAAGTLSSPPPPQQQQQLRRGWQPQQPQPQQQRYELPAGATVATLLAALGAAPGMRLSVNGHEVRDTSMQLATGDEVRWLAAVDAAAVAATATVVAAGSAKAAALLRTAAAAAAHVVASVVAAGAAAADASAGHPQRQPAVAL